MKGNTKGFTLVELLAVIVILAIIALITAPAILNVINDARVKGAEDKAWGTIDAVRMAFTQEQGLGTGTVNGTSGFYTICWTGTAGTSTDKGSCNAIKKVGSTDVKMSGEAPIDGKVDINLSDGSIPCTGLKYQANGKYTCNTDDGNTMTCTPY